MYVKIKPCKEYCHTFTMKHIPSNKVVEVIDDDKEVYFFKPINSKSPKFVLLKNNVYEVTKEGEPICQKK